MTQITFSIKFKQASCSGHASIYMKFSPDSFINRGPRAGRISSGESATSYKLYNSYKLQTHYRLYLLRRSTITRKNVNFEVCKTKLNAGRRSLSFAREKPWMFLLVIWLLETSSVQNMEILFRP